MISKKRKDHPIDESFEGKPEKWNLELKKQKKNSSLKDIPSLTSLFTRKIIVGDGNCLFRAILFSLTGEDSHHLNFRELLCQYILDNKSKYKYYFEDEQEGLELHIEEMKKEKIWGTNLERNAASEMLLFNFEVFYSNSSIHYCTCIHFPDFPTIYLEFENGNHFNSLIPKNNANNITKMIEKQTFQALLSKSTKNTLSQKRYQTLKNLTTIKQQRFDSKPPKIKIELSKHNQAHRRIYPLAKNNHDTYNESFKFLFDKTIPPRFLPLQFHQKCLIIGKRV